MIDLSQGVKKVFLNSSHVDIDNGKIIKIEIFKIILFVVVIPNLDINIIQPPVTHECFTYISLVPP